MTFFLKEGLGVEENVMMTFFHEQIELRVAPNNDNISIDIFSVLVLLNYMDFCPEGKLDFDR